MNKQEILDNIAVNLERERINLGLTQEQMAKKLDISKSAYKSMICGQTQKIDVCVMAKLYELTGKFAFEFLGMDDRKLQIVSKLNGMPEQSLIAIHSAVELERLFLAEHSDYEDYVTMYIPVGDMKDGMIFNSNDEKKINVASYRKVFGDNLHYAIQVTSTHLGPVYHAGDILLISKTAIRDNDVGIFLNRDNHRFYIRKLIKNGTTSILQPINEYGMPFKINTTDHDQIEKWVKFGRVLTKMR